MLYLLKMLFYIFYVEKNKDGNFDKQFKNETMSPIQNLSNYYNELKEKNPTLRLWLSFY